MYFTQLHPDKKKHIFTVKLILYLPSLPLRIHPSTSTVGSLTFTDQRDSLSSKMTFTAVFCGT
jgi:hypothetical protein